MVEYRLPKPGVVGSTPIARSIISVRRTTPMKAWHLIIEDAPLRGSRNMAVDEYLFFAAQREPATFLRFYRWERPTASLGYSQDAAGAADLDFCRANGIDVVRRMTGGKLVLHHRELTYSLASADAGVFTDTLRESYRRISLGMLRGLELMGLDARLAPAAPPAYVRGTMPCFAFPARDEIEIGGLKIVGSAQKRTGPAFLQHGSVPLEKDEDLLKGAARSEAPDVGARMTSLAEALGRPVPFAWAAERFSRGLAEFFAVDLEPLALDGAAWEEIARIEAERYGTEAWTLGRGA
jgi:lipoate-protein ligase A